ncbi:Ribosomal RNA-processing protein 15 [Ceratocystis platani]|uniref:Ribosomal RNA-processing protein 15 n=1 Tax=Ceratocystis fimbriata f. sp. platani TaxID=88771 RepID=A0A0F8BXR3_CERFI|nr:Ribosomal RNA-processing protein 15 [Ceratocystis platani]
MAGPGAARKRARGNDSARPHKKSRVHRQQAYHSSSEESEAEDFAAVNLEDSDNENILDAPADVGGSEDEETIAISSTKEKKGAKFNNESAKTAPSSSTSDIATANASGGDDDDESMLGNDEFDEDMLAAEDSQEDDDDDDEDDDEDDDITGLEGPAVRQKSKSKRNDPTAFATSLSKILSTKLSTSKRADPMLSRSIDAQKASQAIVDSALESKVKRQLKEEKRAALEKGRVKDVLEPKVQGQPKVQLSASKCMEEERKLRKVAQRGVIKLFNAVRAAQVRAVEAQRDTRKEGMLGLAKREAKVQEMTKKGFLDLIASGGGGLKKGPIEEA